MNDHENHRKQLCKMSRSEFRDCVFAILFHHHKRLNKQELALLEKCYCITQQSELGFSKFKIAHKNPTRIPLRQSAELMSSEELSNEVNGGLQHLEYEGRETKPEPSRDSSPFRLTIEMKLSVATIMVKLATRGLCIDPHLLNSKIGLK